jgi:hypothetical protein
LVPADDWVIESVLLVKDKGPEMTAEVTCPVPLPVKRPPRVVEPVPPRLTATVVVPMTEPLELVKRSELVMFAIARFVVVAACALKLPATVVELFTKSEPVVVAPPLIVSPVMAVPPPIVEEACAMSPFDDVKKVVEAYGKVEASVVEVAVKIGAKWIPYVVRLPLMVAAPATERSVPGVVVPMPTRPWFVMTKKVEVA